MIDWHTHLLHNIDDGSKDLKESLYILKSLSEQNVKIAIATPHFFANYETVEDFLLRRNKAYTELKKNIFEGAPEIRLGAEVRYYSGISKMKDLDKLCIEGTNLLLLEMPFSKWTEYVVKELIELSASGNIRLVLAHIERYLKFQEKSTWQRLYESGILMQFNASFFNNLLTRRKALNFLKNNKVHFIGSDCHNMDSRPPKISKTFELIEKKLGNKFISLYNKYSVSMLG